MASNAKKATERQVFDLVYGGRQHLGVTPSERPDFIVEHRDAGRFGVEVTEFFDTGSRARLERIEGYAGDLLAGKDFKHKDDRRLLKVTKVDYETKDGRGRITGVPAIMQRNPSHAELDRALAERVNEKAKSLPDEIDGIAHVNLIVIDRSFCLSRFNPEDFSEFYSDPASQLRKAVSQSPFREMFLIAEMQGTTGYVPLKMLGMVTELFLFCAAAAETESTKAIPEETEGLEVFASYFQGCVADTVFVVKGSDGTEVIHGSGGLAIPANKGVLLRDYEDGQIPPNAVAVNANLAVSFEPSLPKLIAEIRQHHALRIGLWLPVSAAG